ncbi:expressed unknown protein [Seminavis robusta]|uniref:Uncharacterized protein n=1 Tax=Seminavis robusta TaxID=568900 RepID=A0A9N8DDQ4_9STRA|nr:expressed unknown protein [Seminavis robusta]|eukprot:Sro94_g049130.1 n/a (308) ;mRNA; f:110709-111632
MADGQPVPIVPANVLQAAEAPLAEEDEVAEEELVEEGGPSTPLSLDDPRRMDLTPEEHGWALTIKELMEEEDGLDKLSDYWYAQVALVDKGDVANAMERIHHLQLLREEYDIQDTVAQAERAVAKFMELFPGCFVSFTYNHSCGNYTQIIDISKFHSSVIKKDPTARKVWFQTTYYVNHALSSDMEAIRRGMAFLLECMDFDWKKNFGLEIVRPYWCDIAGFYPLNIHTFRYFHTGVFVNMLTSMAKKFMPVAMRDQYELGCINVSGSLSKLFLTPTVEAANERTMSRFLHSLKLRYKNEKSFTLKR